MAEKKWYNIELEPEYEAPTFRKWLKEEGIKYEASGAGELVHFEVYMDVNEKADANEFLQENVW